MSRKKPKNDNVLYYGYWGNLKALQLRDEYPDKYKFYADHYLLKSYLDSIQELYSTRAEHLREKYYAKYGVTDELFERNSLEWMAQMYLCEMKIRKFLTRNILKSS